jgi:hypothetical protein
VAVRMRFTNTLPGALRAEAALAPQDRGAQGLFRRVVRRLDARDGDEVHNAGQSASRSWYSAGGGDRPLDRPLPRFQQRPHLSLHGHHRGLDARRSKLPTRPGLEITAEVPAPATTHSI